VDKARVVLKKKGSKGTPIIYNVMSNSYVAKLGAKSSDMSI